jgi:glucosamine-6-phosphate deaminase
MTITLANPKGYDSHAAMCEAAADQVIALVRQNPKAVIGLATGATMEPLYAAIVRRYNESQKTDQPLRFKDVTFFTLDEYVGLAKTHPQSYHYYLQTHLFNHIDATPENIHIPDGNAADIAAECQRYESAISHAGGVDMWIVGIGINGHIAFNEPHSKFTDTTHVVKLMPDTREANSRFFNSLSEVPTHAVTVGLGTLRQHAREVMLLASGKEKSAVIATLLEDRIRQKVPATMLSLMPNVTVYADEGALGRHLANHAGRRAGRSV